MCKQRREENSGEGNKRQIGRKEERREVIRNMR